MRFQKLFQRTVAAGPAAWTQDILPADANGNPLPPGITNTTGATGQALGDNVLSVRAENRIGFPSTQIAVSYTPPSGGQATIACKLYFWDALTKQYFQVSNSPITVAAGVVSLFNSMAMQDAPPHAGDLDQALQGATQYILIPTAATTGPGQYTFVWGSLV